MKILAITLTIEKEQITKDRWFCWYVLHSVFDLQPKQEIDRSRTERRMTNDGARMAKTIPCPWIPYPVKEIENAFIEK